MSSKNDANSNQFGFALEVLKLLAEKPLRKTELENLLRDKDISCEDLRQKITRVIGKLRDCGFEIRSAPNRPYELIESVFPVILKGRTATSPGNGGSFSGRHGVLCPSKPNLPDWQP